MTEPTLPESEAVPEFDAVIAFRMEGGNLDIQVSMKTLPADLTNPAVFAGHWIASNWEQLQAAIIAAYAAHNTAEPANDPDAALAGVQETPLVQLQ